MPDSPEKLDRNFPRYEEFSPKVPVWCLTPDFNGAFHRFFDTSPVSPSGKYIALTRMKAEDSLPSPGATAEVILIDLLSGEHEIISETAGWDTQLGAQAQWGKDDTELFYNDMDTSCWKPFGVRHNPRSGEKKKLEGPVYMVSPDGSTALSPCLLRTARTQAGYGVLAPEESIPVNEGAPDADGIFATNTLTGRTRLLISMKAMVDAAGTESELHEKYGPGGFYGFHVKWSPDGSRIMFVIRYKDRAQSLHHQLFTMNADGSDIRVAVPYSEWSLKGGHHPNWCQDSKHLMMNLRIDGGKMRLVKALYDGREYGKMSDKIIGSGHPSIHRDGLSVVTDEYLLGEFAYGDGTTPIRLINLRKEESANIIRMRTEPVYSGPKREMRVDPHPAWDPSFKYIVFNGCPGGRRKVFIADLSRLLQPPAGRGSCVS